VFAELCWTPALLFQAEDRAHRLGQTKRVNIDYIVCKHTLDDLMWPMIANKLRVTSCALNGGQPEQLQFAQSYQLQ
jgi:SWI/SNF-related matrix-associated actin-dependent regulator 1 of chromatin subfamily A